MNGTDGKPLQAAYSTPPKFIERMKTETAPQYSAFTHAFTQGTVKCEWVAFETLTGLPWTQKGPKDKAPQWGCQPKAIEDQLPAVLGQYKDAKIDMWLWCAGAPKTQNGGPQLKVGAPPLGVSYTQWQFNGAYNAVICEPDLAVVVHEINHRYLDNLSSIEGVQLTQFHGLNWLGYERNDLGYNDLLAAYRSIYLHVIRPTMWQRFTLNSTPRDEVPVAASGALYRWADVRDDCWFKLPLLDAAQLAQLTGLPGLKLTARPLSRVRFFEVPEADRAQLRSPYVDKPDEIDCALNNVLSQGRESCAVLHTDSGHWLIVRPEVADCFVEMFSLRGAGEPLEAAGWINEGICPLVVLRAPATLKTPAAEIGYFR